MYGPTAERTTQQPEELRDLYNDRITFNNDLKNLSTLMILTAGDFNGKWTRGHRNDNGQKLVEWCENNKKFLCNTVF